jgi:hypothetical protein
MLHVLGLASTILVEIFKTYTTSYMIIKDKDEYILAFDYINQISSVR